MKIYDIGHITIGNLDIEKSEIEKLEMEVHMKRLNANTTNSSSAPFRLPIAYNLMLQFKNNNFFHYYKKLEQKINKKIILIINSKYSEIYEKFKQAGLDLGAPQSYQFKGILTELKYNFLDKRIEFILRGE